MIRVEVIKRLTGLASSRERTEKELEGYYHKYHVIDLKQSYADEGSTIFTIVYEDGK